MMSANEKKKHAKENWNKKNNKSVLITERQEKKTQESDERYFLCEKRRKTFFNSFYFSFLLSCIIWENFSLPSNSLFHVIRKYWRSLTQFSFACTDLVHGMFSGAQKMENFLLFTWAHKLKFISKRKTVIIHTHTHSRWKKTEIKWKKKENDR